MGDVAIAATNVDQLEVLVVTLGQNSSEWILYSSYSFHMCIDLSSFVNYTKINSGQVLLGNNLSCQMVSIGNIQLKLVDGIVKFPSSVRHVQWA